MVLNLGVKPPPRGHTIYLGGSKMINGRGKGRKRRKKEVLLLKLAFNLKSFLFECFLLDNFTFLPQTVIKIKLSEKSLFGAAANYS